MIYGWGFTRPQRKNRLRLLLPNFGIQIKIVNLIEDEPEPDEEAETVSVEDMLKNYMALYEGIGLHIWNVKGEVGIIYNTHVMEPCQ